MAVADGSRGGPRPWELPALGWGLLRNGDAAFDALFDRYGEVVSLSVPSLLEVLPGVSRVAFVRDPAVIKPLFTASEDQIDSTTANRVMEMLYGDRSLFLIDGSEHRRLRKLLLPRLRGNVLERWAEFIVSSTEREARTWATEDTVRLHPRMLDISLELILEITLGVADVDMPLWKPPMHELLETAASEETAVRYGARRFGGLKYWPKFRRALARCDSLVFGEIARRRNHPEREYRDLLDLLMHAEGEPLTDTELRDQVFTILIAGHETSATTAAWAIERLLRTPHAFEQALTEARTTDEQTYLEAVVHETLRLRPPVAVVGRVTRTPITLAGYEFRANTLIAPVIRSIHRKDDLYDNPEQFDPQRFLDTRPSTFGLIPFGGGPHRCIGDKLAIFQTKLVLRTVLRTVELSPVDPRDEPVKRKAIAYLPGNGVLVHARTRDQKG